MVDLGVILSENIIKHTKEAPPGQKLITTVYNGSTEVSSAILTAVSTTIVSFIPVFTMQAAEGKLFIPLAFTKTFALIAALIVSLFIMPALAHWFFGARINSKIIRKWVNIVLVPLGIILLTTGQIWGGMMILAFGIAGTAKQFKREQTSDKKQEPENKSLPYRIQKVGNWLLEYIEIVIVLIGVTWLLARYWLPLAPQKAW